MACGDPRDTNSFPKHYTKIECPRVTHWTSVSSAICEWAGAGDYPIWNDRVKDLEKPGDIEDFSSGGIPLNSEEATPKHYTKMKMQPIEFIIKNDIGFCEGNIIKYVCRYKEKDGIKDLEKAKEYIQFLINKEKEKQNEA